MLISICICTYNRCNILSKCLHSIENLVDPRPEHDVEIIVIDNNSTDKTPVLVEALMSSFPFRIRYVFEAQQGLSVARNKAIDQAKGDYIAFLDDECIIHPDWLSIIISDINEFRPCIIGGPYIGAFLPGARPKWFKREYGDAYFLAFRYERGFQNEFRASGGNMIIRRDVFETLRFDVGLGMQGNIVKVGEEIELQERFLRDHKFEKVFFEPGIVAHHFIMPEKMRLSYLAKRRFAVGLAIPGEVDQKKALIALRRALVDAILLPIRSIRRDRVNYPFWQNLAYEEVIPEAARDVGTLVKYLRRLRNKNRNRRA
jgi:glucosyl-dolichyl phosphate glucuronosyltransferase